jgi:hypothetical protein
VASNCAEADWPVRRALVGMTEPGQSDGMTPDTATYPGYRFPAEIISHAVWLYHDCVARPSLEAQSASGGSAVT